MIINYIHASVRDRTERLADNWRESQTGAKQDANAFASEWPKEMKSGYGGRREMEGGGRCMLPKK